MRNTLHIPAGKRMVLYAPTFRKNHDTSVYDLDNLTLDLQVRESQDHLRFTIEP